MKNICLLTLALLSLALAGGCAKGGNGQGSGITVTITGSSVIYPNQAVTYLATVKPAGTSQAVTWSIQGNQCTGTPNPCGTIDKNTGAYVAPSAVPSPASFQVVAASVADNTAVGTLPVSVQLIQVAVTPTTSTVGENLVQQFTATASPDLAPQTFSWSCSVGTCVQDPNISGLVVYTAPSSGGNATIQATSTVPNQPAPAVGQAKVTIAASRFPVPNTYAFQFSGYDNSGNPVAATGSFVLASNGSVTDGVEDVLNATGPHQYAVSSVSYAPSSGNHNTNNLGTLTVKLSGGPTNTYTAVLNASGNIQMIEADSFGSGSGILQKSANSNVFDFGAQTFAFGFTGVDRATGGNRVGYVGLLPMNGNGGIGATVPGQLDSNDNGSATTVCATAPCSVTGSYIQPDAGLPTWWQMTLTWGAITQHFDFFIASGTTQTKIGPNDLTLFAISTDPVSASQPALAGTMLYQIPANYNNAAFAGTSISALTGANANVALINGATDGLSGGTGGTGCFAGNYDQNNSGTIVSVPAFPVPNTSGCGAYTYVASASTGRYLFETLGNPSANPATAVPFVLYASGANRGFLLDQSSSAVMTGAMYPQPSKASGSYAPAELTGTYAAATTSNSSSSIDPFVQNLLLTSPGGGVFNVTGVQNPGSASVTGTYSIQLTGTGAITLTSPPPPSVATNVIYAIDFDSTNGVILDFFMMGTTSGTPSALMFAQQ